MAKVGISRRGLLQAAAAAGSVVAFYGPWKHNRVWAQATDKPIRIGITSDASGQYANSGAEERRGIAMAVAEFNDKGGVLGRKIETRHIDTETTPATGSRAAERLISRDGCGFLGRERKRASQERERHAHADQHRETHLTSESTPKVGRG